MLAKNKIKMKNYKRQRIKRAVKKKQHKNLTQTETTKNIINIALNQLKQKPEKQNNEI